MCNRKKKSNRNHYFSTYPPHTYYISADIFTGAQMSPLFKTQITRQIHIFRCTLDAHCIYTVTSILHNNQHLFNCVKMRQFIRKCNYSHVIEMVVVTRRRPEYDGAVYYCTKMFDLRVVRFRLHMSCVMWPYVQIAASVEVMPTQAV